MLRLHDHIRVLTRAIPAALAAALFAVPACSSEPAAGRQSAGDTTLTDARIVAAVEHELQLHPAVPAGDLTVRSADGVVTLRGTVPHLMAAQTSVATAEATRGVRAVISEIVVAPTTRPDSAITKDIRSALLADPATEAFEVEITTTDGAVTLHGIVDSWAEQRLVARVAGAVRGVRAVDNLVAVNHDAVRTDEEIGHEVERLLDTDILLRDASIDANVSDGVVHLDGWVGSAADRRHAAQVAAIDGVERVETASLEVRWWAQDAMTRDAIPAPADTAVRAAIVDAFVLSPRVSSFRPTVEVTDGAVTLRGTVDNLAAKAEAERIAWNTVGVTDVTNELRVAPPLPMEDLALATRVQQALQRDPFLDAYDVVVTADDGIVTLAGTVDHRFAKDYAEDVAMRQRSVLAVVNVLDVEAPVTIKDDVALENDVRAELYWNPWVSADEVAVTASSGTVTLMGTVDSRFERQQAEAEAYDAGAMLVENVLVIRETPDVAGS